MKSKLSETPRKSFAANARGSVAIVMGFSMIPLMLAAGVAADFAVTQTVKARLDAAADAAALAAIKTAQATIINIGASNPNPDPQAIAAGEAQGGKLFLAQAGRNGANLTGAPTVTVTISGQTISATASYNAAVASNFGRLAGVDTLAVQGAATASLTMGKYLDFYLLLDVSASMGLPSTPTGQSALAAINPDGSGCFFACHFSGYHSYNTARANDIQLRIDAVGAGVAALMSEAQQTQTLPNQYRMGVYPFITHANTFVDLTSDLTGDAYSVASAINYNASTGSTSFGGLLDTGNDSVFASSFNPNYRVTSNSPVDTLSDWRGRHAYRKHLQRHQRQDHFGRQWLHLVEHAALRVFRLGRHGGQPILRHRDRELAGRDGLSDAPRPDRVDPRDGPKRMRCVENARRHRRRHANTLSALRRPDELRQ